MLRSLKPAVFVGSSRKDLRGFPAAVRGEIGQALFEAQLGDHPPNAKHGLHAFQKKSTSGIATPQRHLDLVRQRLRDAETIHKATKANR